MAETFAQCPHCGFNGLQRAGDAGMSKDEIMKPAASGLPFIYHFLSLHLVMCPNRKRQGLGTEGREAAAVMRSDMKRVEANRSVKIEQLD